MLTSAAPTSVAGTAPDSCSVAPPSLFSSPTSELPPSASVGGGLGSDASSPGVGMSPMDATVVDLSNTTSGLKKAPSFRPPAGVPRHKWGVHLPHFDYRRVMHDYFDHMHMYHPQWLPRGSTIAAMANIAASTAGIGTFAMPYAAHRCGIAYFTIGMIITLCLMTYTQHIISHVVDLTGLHSYEMLTRKAFKDSRAAEVVVEVVLIITCIGTIISAVVIVGDGASSILTGNGVTEKEGLFRFLIQLAIFVVLMLPLSLLRTIGALKYASMFGISALCVVIVYAIAKGLSATDTSRLEPVETTSFLSFSVGTSLLFFALNNQFNTIEIYSEMTERSPMKYTKMIFTTMLMISVLYVVMGLSELMEYGPTVSGNVLKSFDGGSPVAAVMIIAVMCKVTFSFPLLIFPTREALLHLLNITDVKTASPKLYYGATVVIAAGAFAIGIVAPTVVTLFGIIGSLCVGTFAFILPSLYFWRFSILPIVTEGVTEAWVPNAHIAINVVNFAIGCFIIVAGTAAALIEL